MDPMWTPWTLLLGQCIVSFGKRFGFYYFVVCPMRRGIEYYDAMMYSQVTMMMHNTTIITIQNTSKVQDSDDFVECV